jgi:outer membrane protein TolC
MKNRIIPIILLILPLALLSQEKLTLNDAINIALRNNYQIIISRNESEIAGNNLSIGNAGFLPTIDVSAGKNYSINNSDKTYQNGNVSKVDGAEATVFSANASLDWTLFDGLRMFTSYEQLTQLKQMSDAILRADIEKVVYSVMTNYYMLVRQKNIIQVNKENLELSKERLRIINEKYNVGSASRLDVLNAQVDFNGDYTALAKQEELYYGLKVELNELIARDKNIDFDVDDRLDLTNTLPPDSLKNRMLEYNPELLAAEQNIKVMNLNSRIFTSEYYPRIGFSADYNYINSKDNAGFLARNINNGFTLGLNISMNLFDGANTSRKIQNSKVAELSAQTEYERIKSALLAQFYKSYHLYKKNIEIVAYESLNIEIARENFNISQEKLKLGTFSQLEFREAQKNFVAAQSRLIQSKSEAKLNEIELLRLCGLLIGK